MAGDHEHNDHDASDGESEEGSNVVWDQEESEQDEEQSQQARDDKGQFTSTEEVTEEESESAEEEEGDVVKDGEETVEDEILEEPTSDTLYVYRIPLEVNGNTRRAIYDVDTSGEGFLSYYGGTEHVYITDTASAHLHKDSVNVTVEEVPRTEVEEADNIIVEVL